jgi:hypothetical protein
MRHEPGPVTAGPGSSRRGAAVKRPGAPPQERISGQAPATGLGCGDPGGLASWYPGIH